VAEDVGRMLFVSLISADRNALENDHSQCDRAMIAAEQERSEADIVMVLSML
jgi:hypothetical protein